MIISRSTADLEADAAEALGVLYREIQSKEYCCSEFVCVYPHDGNCWCFNRALALHNASGMEARQGQDAQRLDGEAATARPDAQKE